VTKDGTEADLTRVVDSKNDAWVLEKLGPEGGVPPPPGARSDCTSRAPSVQKDLTVLAEERWVQRQRRNTP